MLVDLDFEIMPAPAALGRTFTSGGTDQTVNSHKYGWLRRTLQERGAARDLMGTLRDVDQLREFGIGHGLLVLDDEAAEARQAVQRALDANIQLIESRRQTNTTVNTREQRAVAPKPAPVAPMPAPAEDLAGAPAEDLGGEPAEARSSNPKVVARWHRALRRTKAIGVISTRLNEIRVARQERNAQAEQFGGLSMAQLVHMARQYDLVEQAVYVSASRAQLIELLLAHTRGEQTTKLTIVADPLVSRLQRAATWRLGDSATDDSTGSSSSRGGLVRANSAQSARQPGAQLPSPTSSRIRSQIRRIASTPARVSADTRQPFLRPKIWELLACELEVTLEHMQQQVPLLCSTNEMGAVEAKQLMSVYRENLELFTEGMIDMWRGVNDKKIFGLWHHLYCARLLAPAPCLIVALTVCALTVCFMLSLSIL